MDCGLNVASISPPLLYLGYLAPPNKMLLEKTHLIEVPGSLLLGSLSVRNLSRRFEKQLKSRIFYLCPETKPLLQQESVRFVFLFLPCYPRLFQPSGKHSPKYLIVKSFIGRPFENTVLNIKIFDCKKLYWETFWSLWCGDWQQASSPLSCWSSASARAWNHNCW